MNTFQILFLALIIDFAIGEPDAIWRRYPHPAVIFGNIIAWFEQRLNSGALRMIKGIAVITVLSIGGLATGWMISWLPDFDILELLLVSILLAYKSLTDHVSDVATALKSSLSEGRTSVAKIVGRDPNTLDETGVAAAAIESSAENFSDGVTAPAFWYLILGLPGLLLYKIVNTADSMIGHRSERYNQFGFGAAKLDDALNWLPARMTGGLMCLCYRSKGAFISMQAEAPLHRSPNAGWPEAAMAAIINVRLSGPRTYDGEVSDEGYINPMGRKSFGANAISEALVVLKRSWLVFTGAVGSIAILTWVF